MAAFGAGALMVDDYNRDNVTGFQGRKGIAPPMKTVARSLKGTLAIICALALTLTAVPFGSTAFSYDKWEAKIKAQENLISRTKETLAKWQTQQDSYRAELANHLAEREKLQAELDELEASPEREEYLEKARQATNGFSDKYVKLIDAWFDVVNESINPGEYDDVIAQKLAVAKQALETLLSEEEKRIDELDDDHDDIVEYLTYIGATDAANLFSSQANSNNISGNSEAGKLSNWYKAINYMANINSMQSQLAHYPMKTNYTDMVKAQLESAYAQSHETQTNDSLLATNQFISLYQGNSSPYDEWYKNEISLFSGAYFVEDMEAIQPFIHLFPGNATSLAVGVAPGGAGDTVAQILDDSKPIGLDCDVFNEGIDLNQSNVYKILGDISFNGNPNVGSFRPTDELSGTGVSYCPMKQFEKFAPEVESVLCMGCGRFCPFGYLLQHNMPYPNPPRTSYADHHFYNLSYQYDTADGELYYWMDYGHYATPGTTTAIPGQTSGALSVDTVARQLYGYLNIFSPPTASYSEAVNNYAAASAELSDAVSQREKLQQEWLCSRFDRQHLFRMVILDTKDYADQLRAAGVDPEELYDQYDQWEIRAINTELGLNEKDIENTQARIDRRRQDIDKYTKDLQGYEQELANLKAERDKYYAEKDNPDIRALQDLYDSTQALLDSVVTSSNGVGVPTDEQWATAGDHFTLSSALNTAKYAIQDYVERDAITRDEVVAATKTLQEKVDAFKAAMKPGLGSGEKPSPPSSSENVPVYRLFDKVSGEHLYTTDQNEVKELKKTGLWNDEGVKWYGPSEGTPVYRLFNVENGEHLYTCDPNEISTLIASEKWKVDNDDKPMFNSFEEGDSGAVPVYRLYNSTEPAKGAHLWTLDANEMSTLLSSDKGWKDEGEKFYAVKA